MIFASPILFASVSRSLFKDFVVSSNTFFPCCSAMSAAFWFLKIFGFNSLNPAFTASLIPPSLNPVFAAIPISNPLPSPKPKRSPSTLPIAPSVKFSPDAFEIPPFTAALRAVCTIKFSAMPFFIKLAPAAAAPSPWNIKNACVGRAANIAWYGCSLSKACKVSGFLSQSGSVPKILAKLWAIFLIGSFTECIKPSIRFFIAGIGEPESSAILSISSILNPKASEGLLFIVWFIWSSTNLLILWLRCFICSSGFCIWLFVSVG